MTALHRAECDAWRPDFLWITLSEEERVRAGRFLRSLDRDRFVVRRGLLRRLLAERLGCPPQAVPLSTGPHGKPCLGGDPAGARSVTGGGDWPIFNLSRSAGLVLYALAEGEPGASESGIGAASRPAIGVDLERIDVDRRTLDDLLRIASRFAPQEARWLRELPPADASAVLHRLWTCKEACLKCLGTGIGGPGPELADVVQVAAADADGIERWQGGDGLEWIVRSFEPCAGHVAAVARQAGQGGSDLPRAPTLIEPTAAERRVSPAGGPPPGPGPGAP
jgi:4'-phosphopantetheinyl transferase